MFQLRSIAPILFALLLACRARAAAPETTSVDLGGGVKLELVEISAGSFEQGSPAGETGRRGDERLRPVTLSRGFWIGKFPVTRGQFARFVQETAYRTEAEVGSSGGFGFDGKSLVQRKEFNWRNPGFPQTDEHPVVLVTYDDARAFAQWMAKRTRRTMDLPTEAQWEYACRAGSTSAFYNGDDAEKLADIAWFAGNADGGTRPVGKKQPNAWGLFDMSGQVYQWCLDWHADYPEGHATDPLQTIAGGDKPRRLLRGGSWIKEAAACRSAARWRNTPGSRNADNGFRVVAADRREALSPVESPDSSATSPRSIPPAQTRSAAPPISNSASDNRGRGPGQSPSSAVPPPGLNRSQSDQAPPDEPNGPSFWNRALRWVAITIGVFIALIVLMAILVAWQARRSGDTLANVGAAARPSPIQFRPRIVADGFWLDSPPIEAGTVIRYRCMLDGERQTGEYVALSGRAGQFIYTGATPAQVEILELTPPGRAASPDASPGVFDESRTTGPVVIWDQPYGSTPSPPAIPPSPQPPRPEPSRGFPPAYS